MCIYICIYIYILGEAFKECVRTAFSEAAAEGNKQKRAAAFAQKEETKKIILTPKDSDPDSIVEAARILNLLGVPSKGTAAEEPVGASGGKPTLQRLPTDAMPAEPADSPPGTQPPILPVLSTAEDVPGWQPA